LVGDLSYFFILDVISFIGWPVQLVLLQLFIALSLTILMSVSRENTIEDSHLTEDEQASFLKSILDHSGTSSAILDADGFIRYVNFGFEALFNADELPLVGRNIAEIHQLKKLDRSFSEENSSVVSVHGDDGISYLVKYFTVTDDDQQIVGRFLKILPDIKRHENVLDYDLSHELKTPLHAVLGFSDLLKKDQDLTPDQGQLLDNIIYHSKELDEKISNLVGSEEEEENAEETYSSNNAVKKILVVDDVSINRTLLKLMLKRYGLEVQEASNGEAAMNILESWNADTILMDLSMPVMDGIETVKAIRAKGKPDADSKIIAVTATQRYSKEELKNVGFDDLMQKPFKEEDLLSRLGIEVQHEAK